MSITQYQYWLLQVSTFGKFPKMPYKLLKVLANPLAIIKISSISLIGYSNTFICVAIWEISTISPYFWLIGSKKHWHFSKFRHLHTSYYVLCMVKHKSYCYFPIGLAHWL